MDDETEVDTKIRVKEVGRHFVHKPKKPTIYYWKRVGILNGHGRRIKLRFFQEGGRLYTTPEEIRRFKECVQEGR